VRVLLRQSTISSAIGKIKQFAEKVGFNDYKHFVYVFKKIVGVTPTIYRENQQKEPNNE